MLRISQCDFLFIYVDIRYFYNANNRKTTIGFCCKRNKNLRMDFAKV